MQKYVMRLSKQTVFILSIIGGVLLLGGLGGAIYAVVEKVRYDTARRRAKKANAQMLAYREAMLKDKDLAAAIKEAELRATPPEHSSAPVPPRNRYCGEIVDGKTVFKVCPPGYVSPGGW